MFNAKVLRDANYQPHFIPALQFEYINTQELAGHLKHPESFSGNLCIFITPLKL